MVILRSWQNAPLNVFKYERQALEGGWQQMEIHIAVDSSSELLSDLSSNHQNIYRTATEVSSSL